MLKAAGGINRDLGDFKEPKSADLIKKVFYGFLAKGSLSWQMANGNRRVEKQRKSVHYRGCLPLLTVANKVYWQCKRIK